MTAQLNELRRRCARGLGVRCRPRPSRGVHKHTIGRLKNSAVANAQEASRVGTKGLLREVEVASNTHVGSQGGHGCVARHCTDPQARATGRQKEAASPLWLRPRCHVPCGSSSQVSDGSAREIQGSEYTVSPHKEVRDRSKVSNVTGDKGIR